MFEQKLPTARLIDAITNNDLPGLRQAIEDGADINADRSGNTPLILAVSHENVEAVFALIDAGANPNQPNHHGITVAHEACKRGLSDVIERLAQNPMIMLSRNNRAGNTPAHMAAASGQISCLAALASAQAALDEQGKEGKTPLMLAIDLNDMACTRFLIENGARLDVVDEAGVSVRQRLTAWPAAANLASAASPAPVAAAPSSAASTDAPQEEPHEAPAPAEEFMGIGTIRKRRPNP